MNRQNYGYELKILKENMKNISVKELRRQLNGVRQDKTMCYYNTLFTDSDMKKYVLSIGALDDDITIKYGIIESIVIDYSDILLPYYYDNENNCEVLDTEYIIEDNITDAQLQLIINDSEDNFIECLNNGVFNIEY